MYECRLIRDIDKRSKREHVEHGDQVHRDVRPHRVKWKIDVLSTWGKCQIVLRAGQRIQNSLVDAKQNPPLRECPINSLASVPRVICGSKLCHDQSVNLRRRCIVLTLT